MQRYRDATSRTLLSGGESGNEIIIVKGRVDDGVAVVLQVGRFDATGN